MTTNASNNAWNEHVVRVYYEDTDAQGVVYFANYLRFMERGRTEWLRERGIAQNELISERNLCFTLVDTDIKFLRPARFDDLLAVRTRVTELAGARIQFEQNIYRHGDDELLCAAKCAAACVTADAFRPTRLPKDLLGIGLEG